MSDREHRWGRTPQLRWARLRRLPSLSTTIARRGRQATNHEPTAEPAPSGSRRQSTITAPEHLPNNPMAAPEQEPPWRGRDWGTRAHRRWSRHRHGTIDKGTKPHKLLAGDGEMGLEPEALICTRRRHHHPSTAAATPTSTPIYAPRTRTRGSPPSSRHGGRRREREPAVSPAEDGERT